MYCGGEVIVREAIQLAAGRVREFTNATPVEKTYDESKPFPVEQVRNQTWIIFAVFAGLAFLTFLCGGRDFGLIMAGTFLVVGIILFALRTGNVRKLERANEAMSKVAPRKIVEAYKGHCPYCDSDITLPAGAPGVDCPVCNHRIVIRDSKFFSVETPVGGIKLSKTVNLDS